MAVSQISMSDSDISGTHNEPSHGNTQETKQVNKNYDSKKSVGMDDLMSNLTSNNMGKPDGKY